MSEPALTEAEQDAMTDAAAHWCMRLDAADCTPGERKAFERWLGAHPLHAVEYQAVLEIWDVSAHISPVNPAPSVDSQPALDPVDEPPKARPR